MNLGVCSTITRFGDNSGTSRSLMKLGLKWIRQVRVRLRGIVIYIDREFNVEKHRWERPVTTIQAPFFPAHMAFHAYDPHLVITNETDTVRYVTDDIFSRLALTRAVSVVYMIGDSEGGWRCSATVTLGIRVLRHCI